MSGIVGSKFNIRGSGLVGSLGTDGQHMLSSGAGKTNVFETVSASADFVKLASTSCSAAATLAIDGFFTSDYDRYILYCIGIGFTDTTPAASDRFTFRLNQSATAVTSGYQYAKLYCYNQGVSAQFDGTYFFGMYLNENELTNRGNLIIEIMDPLQTSFNHGCFWRGQGIDAGTQYETSLGSGVLASTTAVTGVTLASTETFPFTVDSAVLYGIKN